jgi:hypothetical protein
MSYLTSGFSRRLSGPDYVSGHHLSRLFEEWEYAWTPMVEASLIELAHEAASLHQGAIARLNKAESDLGSTGQGRSSAAVAALLAQAAVIGVSDHADRLTGKLALMIEQDPSLGSLVAATRQILGLWRAKEVLDLTRPEALMEVMGQALPQMAYLVDGLEGLPADQEDETVGTLVGMRELIRSLETHFDISPLTNSLARLRDSDTASPGVKGALFALGVADGEIDDDALAHWITIWFAPGADPDFCVRLLSGVMRAAPDLVLHTPELFTAIDTVIAGLDDMGFLTYLPDLRRVFGEIKPFETARLAEKVAAATGFAPTQILGEIGDLTSADLRRGTWLEQGLVASLVDDQLMGWVAGDPSGEPQEVEDE